MTNTNSDLLEDFFSFAPPSRKMVRRTFGAVVGLWVISAVLGLALTAAAIWGIVAIVQAVAG